MHDMTNITLSGKPQVGNPHVRFFKGEAASGDPTRESRLGSMGKAVLVFSLALAAAVTWAAAEGTDITADLQGRIDAAFRSGGGTVTIDRGEWRIRGIRLRSNVTLRLSAGAVVRASRDMDDFDVLSKDVVEPLNRQELPVFICHIKPEQFLRWSRAIICIYKARNVKILGEEGAVIDGRNSYDPQGEEGFRGAHGITAVDSEDVEVGGFEIWRTGNWATMFYRSRDVRFHDLKVRGGHDGVHVRLCDQVSVRKCDFRCGDDCVAGFDNTDVTVEDCRMNTACSAFRFGGQRVRIRRCAAVGPGEWPIRNSLPLADRIAGNDCIGKGRRNMLSFFTYFSDLTHGEVKADQGDIVIEDCTVSHVDRFLHYNFSGNEVWQCGRPLRNVVFRRCTATGLGMSLCAYAPKELPFELTVEDCAFAFARPVSEFVRAANLKSFRIVRTNVGDVNGPLVRYWGEDAPPLEAVEVEGVKVETERATGKFSTKAI